MKNIAILGPTSSTDVWNIPISFHNHFVKQGFVVKFYNTLTNDKFDQTGLVSMISDFDNRVFVPDMVFHLDFGLFDSSLLNKSSVPTAKWVVESGDDPQNFRLNFRKIRDRGFDLVLTSDIRCAEEYGKHGIRAAWCPYFADPDQFDIVQDPVVDSVTTRSIEEPFFRDLKQLLGSKFEARTEFLQGKDHSRHLMRGKIVVQNSKYKEITRRVFEGMMAHRLVITDRPDPATSMDLIFKENVDIVYFDDINDCAEKIKYFANNDDHRNTIADSGFHKVSTKHTTAERIKKILELL
jgi:hypothetical protein